MILQFARICNIYTFNNLEDLILKTYWCTDRLEIKTKSNSLAFK